MDFRDWEGFQMLAKKLVKLNNEAMLRSAINRSYYAAFQMSVSFAEANFSFVKDRMAIDQKRILDTMRHSRELSIKKAGRKLGRLKDNRRKADYDERTSVNQPLAQTSTQLADEIIQSVKSWKPDP